MKHVLLHIGATHPSAEDISAFRPIVDALSARLHVIYTQPDPLSAGGQHDISAAKLPELHQGMEAEAREKLRSLFGTAADGATIQIRPGDPAQAIADYANEAKIDLIVVGLASEGEEESDLAHALIGATTCSLLVWRAGR